MTYRDLLYFQLVLPKAFDCAAYIPLAQLSTGSTYKVRSHERKLREQQEQGMLASQPAFPVVKYPFLHAVCRSEYHGMLGGSVFMPLTMCMHMSNTKCCVDAQCMLAGDAV